MTNNYAQGASCVNTKQDDMFSQTYSIFGSSNNSLNDAKNNKYNLCKSSKHNTSLCKDSPRIKPWTLERARSALLYIPPNINRIDWLKIGTALKTEFGDDALNLFLEWSAIDQHDYNKRSALSAWRSAKISIVTMGTVYREAKARGWEDKPLSTQDRQKLQADAMKRAKAQSEKQKRDQEQKRQKQIRAQTALNGSIPALSPAYANGHTYLRNKQSDGLGAYLVDYANLTAETQKIYPFSQLKPKKPALFIPLQNQTGSFVGGQLIDRGKKRLVAGSINSGSYAYLGYAPLPDTSETIYIGEGYATVNSVLQADRNGFGVMAKDCSQLATVAKLIRDRHSNARIVILGDNDKSQAGQNAAKEAAEAVGGIALIPNWVDTGKANQKSTDWNDVHVTHSLNVLRKSVKPAPKRNAYAKPTLNGKPVKHIRQQYLGDSITQTLVSLGVAFLVVRSGMKSGKTTAAKKAIKSVGSENFLYITPRRNLNRALANELGLNFYEGVKKEKDKELRKEMAKRMVITPNSLVQILREFPDLKYQTIFIDESESVASMLVSKATEKKLATLETLIAASQKAGSVVAMDAHAGRMSDTLMELLSDRKDFGYLLNSYKGWTDIKVHIIKGKTYSDRKAAIIAKIIGDLKNGKRVYIGSSSKAFCEDINKILREEFPQLKIALIDSDTKNHADIDYLLQNPNSVTYFDVVIGSPSVSVGVSFDPEHFHRCYGIFPNTDGTGLPDDAIQGMARPRNLIDKKWFIVLPDDAPVFANIPKSANEIRDAHYWRYQQAIIEAKTPVDAHALISDTIESKTLALDAVCQCERFQTKNNFIKSFMGRIGEMGCSVAYIDAVASEEDKAKDKATKEERKELERLQVYTGKDITPQELEAIKTGDISPKDLQAPKMTDEEYRDTKYMLKFAPDQVSPELKAAMPRYEFEKKLGVDLGQLEESEIKACFELDEKSATKKCIMRETALSSSQFTRNYTKSLLNGIGEDEAFKRDILSSRHNYVIERKMLRYALPYIDGKPYTHKSLKRSAMAQWFANNEKHINALRLITLPKNWKDKPALLMNALLDKMGIGATSKQIGKGKSKVRTWTAKRDILIEQYFDRRQQEGMNWVQRTEYLMSVYGGIVGYAVTEQEVVELGLAPSDLAIISEALKHIPIKEHKAHMTTYKTVYKQAGYKVANQFIKENAQNYHQNGGQKAA